MQFEQSYSKNWLKLIILLAGYFYVVRATSSKQWSCPDTEVQMLNNFVVCSNNNTHAWCMTLGQVLNQEFQACIETCPELQTSVFPKEKAILIEVLPSTSELNRACLLNCFFSQETAMYRQAQVPPEPTVDFLNSAIICIDHENAAHCTSSDTKRRTKLIHCLQEKEDLKITRSSNAPASFEVISKFPIRQTVSFHQCFFNEESAIALRRVTRTKLMSFFEKNPFVGKKSNSRTRFIKER